MVARLGAPVPVALTLLLPSCGKTMTEADCQRVGRHMRTVWDAEAAAVAP